LGVVPNGGILLMISGATEGFPFTSIHIRGDLAQDIVGFIGLFLAIFGILARKDEKAMGSTRSAIGADRP
jgi:hypothetical protein